jgi:hypothetical protein
MKLRQLNKQNNGITKENKKQKEKESSNLKKRTLSRS